MAGPNYFLVRDNGRTETVVEADDLEELELVVAEAKGTAPDRRSWVEELTDLHPYYSTHAVEWQVIENNGHGSRQMYEGSTLEDVDEFLKLKAGQERDVEEEPDPRRPWIDFNPYAEGEG